jgi:large subunit ribosomal protein L4
MAKIAVYNIEGKEVEQLDLDDSVFGLPANDDLVHQVAVTIAGNRRQVLAHTKTRGDRAGSGIKPWRQKGTGRARVGSVRTPVWKKGGVAFGPRSDRNYKAKINKKMNAKAIATVLSGKLRDGEIKILDSITVSENKTKKMAEMVKNMKINGRVLVSFSQNEKDLKMFSRNISHVENILTAELNVFDMLNNKNLLMSKESVAYLTEKYHNSKADKSE